MSDELKERSPLLIQSLLGDLNHQIRSPLNTILNMVDLSLRQSPNKPLQNYLQTIERSAARLLSLFDDIIYLSEKHGSKADTLPFRLTSLLEEVREFIGPLLQAQATELCLEVDKGIPEFITGSQTVLKHVLVQILDLSVGKLQPGQISVILSWEQKGGIRLTIKAILKQGGKRPEGDLNIHGKLALCQSLLHHIGTELSVVRGETDLSFNAFFPVQGVFQKREGCLSRINEKPPLVFMVNSDGFSSALMVKTFDMEGISIRQETSLETAAAFLRGAVADLIVGILNWQDVKDERSLGIDILRSAAGREHLPIIVIDIPAVELMGLTSADIADAQVALLMKPTPGRQVVMELARVLGWDWPGNQGVGPETTPQIEDGELAEEKLEGINVLIVEDDRINQQILVDILKGKGIRFVVASTGKAALKAIERRRFDAIFMDITLPDQDGFTLTESIRKSVLNSSTPVIALTASTSNRQKCFDAGMDAFLSKPYSQEKLLEALSRLV